MKALIPTGGAGTRLRPITHTSAKQLIPVANKPILFYVLEALAEAGIVEVGMVVGDTRQEIMDGVGDGAAWGLKVTYLPQDEPLGLAHCVLIAREFLAEDDFVMYLGDNLLHQGVAPFVEAFEADRALGGDDPPAAQILLAHVPDPQRFGVAELDASGRVLRLVEKPAVPPSDLALVGVYLFDPHVHEAVRAISPSARGELEITEAIQWLIDAGLRVRTEVVEGYWKDLGELDALLEGNRLVLEALDRRIEGSVDESSRIEGRVVLAPGSEVVRSTIRGPAVVGEGARIVDSFVGPFTSIGARCTVVRSEVEHSIVLEEGRVEAVPRLVDSLVGRRAEVTRSERRPRASRLMIGDHSRVDLG
ncbi:MAG: glucose-1-phosphate thymidylyltransferase [Actinomycetota bacterium]|nr:glucose-1-phosphate thymidylyltransferase [Actinomycetota bacterium]